MATRKKTVTINDLQTIMGIRGTLVIKKHNFH